MDWRGDGAERRYALRQLRGVEQTAEAISDFWEHLLCGSSRSKFDPDHVAERARVD
jgi:hypothetical protein